MANTSEGNDESVRPQNDCHFHCGKALGGIGDAEEKLPDWAADGPIIFFAKKSTICTMTFWCDEIGARRSKKTEECVFMLVLKLAHRGQL